MQRQNKQKSDILIKDSRKNKQIPRVAVQSRVPSYPPCPALHLSLCLSLNFKDLKEFCSRQKYKSFMLCSVVQQQRYQLSREENI